MYIYSLYIKKYIYLQIQILQKSSLVCFLSFKMIVVNGLFPFYSLFIPFLFCCKHQPVDQGSFLHDVEAINQLPASQSLSWSQNELILHQTWLDRPCQMTTSCMRSCNLRPRPWSARTRARGRNNTPQRGGGYFSHFRQLVSSVRSNSSAFTVSQPVQGAPPQTSRPLRTITSCSCSCWCLRDQSQ